MVRRFACGAARLDAAVDRRAPTLCSRRMREQPNATEVSLAQRSAEEMVLAAGLRDVPQWLRDALARALFHASLPLARTLARFDADLESTGLHAAAATALAEFGAAWECSSVVPSTGPLLVVANHPGAYDALMLMAAMRRSDLAIVAAERSFLRALPNLSKRLLWVSDSCDARRANAVRKAWRHLSSGGALLHFGAGRIEADPAFGEASQSGSLPWCQGTGALVRGAAQVRGTVVAALVMGVHSARVKRLILTRVAERFGISTLAPLLQITLRRYRDVRARVAFSDALAAAELVRLGSSDVELAELLRARSAMLSSNRL